MAYSGCAVGFLVNAWQRAAPHVPRRGSQARAGRCVEIAAARHRAAQVEAAKVLIRDRLLQKYSTVRAALKAVDDDGSGTLTREEVKKMLKEFYLMKYFDFYTGQTRGDLDPKVVDTLLDIVDVNEDGTINYTEFSQVVMAGAN